MIAAVVVAVIAAVVAAVVIIAAVVAASVIAPVMRPIAIGTGNPDEIPVAVRQLDPRCRIVKHTDRAGFGFQNLTGGNVIDRFKGVGAVGRFGLDLGQPGLDFNMVEAPRLQILHQTVGGNGGGGHGACEDHGGGQSVKTDHLMSFRSDEGSGGCVPIRTR